jgi:uncharacterized protein YidB (DUF937 family)
VLRADSGTLMAHSVETPSHFIKFRGRRHANVKVVALSVWEAGKIVSGNSIPFEEEASMGLMDVLNGMQNGPRGPSKPGGGGMSPLTMALLGLIAYKAVKSFAGGAQAEPATPSAAPGAGPGSLGGLGGLLGGLLGGGAAGSALSGGLGDLLKQFEQGGQGAAANSWVGSGANKAISPTDLAGVLGEDRIKELSSLSGMSRQDLLSGLSQQLPSLIDRLTPNGRLPSPQEAERLL